MKLRLLGQMSLTTMDGRDIDLILARPKAMAVLLYLCVAAPRGYVRRDRLLTLFWPEFDGVRARHALRQTCYVLRHSLPGAISKRGTEEIRLNRAGLWCDATEMELAFHDGRFEEVCELYRGEFADGLHVTGSAPEFDYWLSAERERLQRIAVEAAWRLTDEAKRTGDAEVAAGCAARALDIAPFDEISLRRQVEVLDHFGDRSRALQAYDRFARRLRAEFDVDPSPETQTLIEDVRRRMKVVVQTSVDELPARWRQKTRSAE
jgi:DNA-binding SARP family transcriptional activator